METIVDRYAIPAVLGALSLGLFAAAALMGYLAKGESPAVRTGARALALVIATFLGFVAITFAQNNAAAAARQRELAALSDRIPVGEEYLRDPAGMNSSILRQKPPVRGKVLPVRLDTGVIDPAVLNLPEGLRPRSADEVGTVAWLDWGAKDVGVRIRRGHREAITDEWCVVTLIDRKDWRAIGQERLSSRQEVAAYLGSLQQAGEPPP